MGLGRLIGTPWRGGIGATVSPGKTRALPWPSHARPPGAGEGRRRTVPEGRGEFDLRTSCSSSKPAPCLQMISINRSARASIGSKTPETHHLMRPSASRCPSRGPHGPVFLSTGSRSMIHRVWADGITCRLLFDADWWSSLFVKKPYGGQCWKRTGKAYDPAVSS